MATMIAELNAQKTHRQESTTQPALSCEFTVGDWLVLPQLNRIRQINSHEERQMEPRLIKLLCFLAANDERVLSREELVQELWPRVVVNENSLTRAISELRKLLQCKNSSPRRYIETIPKRGYRLLPKVELNEAQDPVAPPYQLAPWPGFFMQASLGNRSTLWAVCLSLLIAGLVVYESPGADDASNVTVLSDELFEPQPDYMGGELQLSTLEGNSPAVESIAMPVVSTDQKQYAFIQYDTSGSTIFLGNLGTAVEPEPVFFSNEHLFNLAWSPIGNNLLFAKKPTLTAAVYPANAETAELVTLNLNTLETSRLVKDVNPADSQATTNLNLT